MITRTDNFNRASLGSDWLQGQSTGTIDIYNSDSYMASVNDAEVRIDWDREACHADQRAQCVVENVRTTNWQHYVGISVRGARSTTKTFYAFQADIGSQYVFSYVSGGTPTMYLNGGVAGISAGDVMKLEIVGTALKAWLNAGELVNTTSSDISSGQVGAEGYCDNGGPYTGSDTTRADDWEASWEGSEGMVRRFGSRTRPAMFKPGLAR